MSCLVTVAAVCACVVTSLLVGGAPDLLQGAGPDLLAHNQTWHHWDLVQAAYQVEKHFQATLHKNCPCLECCGVSGRAGADQWLAVLGSYPDSCCTVKYPGCGQQVNTGL